MAGRRLSRRQQERIRQLQEQRRQCMSQDAVPNQPSGHSEAGQLGLVIANYGPTLIVEDHKGDLYRCSMRQNLGQLVCGDRVIWRPHGSEEGVVIALEERRSLLTRPDFNGRPKPLAANLDQVIVVIAPLPEPNEFLIDRYLVAISTLSLETALVVNKADLLAEAKLSALQSRLYGYQRIGYPLVFVSAKTGQGLTELGLRLKNGVNILVGQSGVGKSSLIKALLPGREVRIRALSEATGRGTHTTTTTALYHLPDGGDLIDSPGVRSFGLAELKPADLDRGFTEFAPYLGNCRFSDCSHTEEPGCALREAVARGEIELRRLQSYQQLKNALRAAGFPE